MIQPPPPLLVEQHPLRIRVAVVRRALAGRFFKGIRKIMAVSKADLIANLRDREVRVRQECLCQFHFPLQNICFQRRAGRPLEKCRDVFLIIPKVSCHFADLDRFAHTPGYIIHDIRVELLFATLHGDIAPREVQLAVKLAQDSRRHMVVQIHIPIIPVAILKLFEEYDEPVQARHFAVQWKQDAGFLGRKRCLVGIVDTQVVVDARVGKVRPVESAGGRAESVLVAGRADDYVLALVHGVFRIVLRYIQTPLCHYDEFKVHQFAGHMNPVLVRRDKFPRPVELEGEVYMKVKRIHITFSYLLCKRGENYR